MESIIIFTNKGIIEDKGLGTFQISTTQFIEKIDVGDGKQFIIAYDGETVKPDEIVNAIPDGAVYILYHSSPEKGILEILTEKLKKKSISVIPPKKSAHTESNIYGLLEIISDNKKDLGELKKVFQALKLAIAGNPVLESLIRLHKTLSIAQLKNENPINTLNGQDKYELAFKLWKDENNGNKHDVKTLLDWTSEQIPENSKHS